MTWTQGEDELLAAGLLRFGLEWSLIMKHLIPIKTETEIRDRQKNRCHRVEGNIIRVGLRRTSGAGSFAELIHTCKPCYTHKHIATLT